MDFSRSQYRAKPRSLLRLILSIIQRPVSTTKAYEQIHMILCI